MLTFNSIRRIVFKTLDNHKYMISNISVDREHWMIEEVELMDSHPFFRQKITLPYTDFQAMIDQNELLDEENDFVRLNSGMLMKDHHTHKKENFIKAKDILGSKLRTNDRAFVGHVNDLILSTEDGTLVDFVVKAPYKGWNGKQYIFSPLLIKDIDIEKQTLRIGVRRTFIDKCPTYNANSYDFMYRRGLISHYHSIEDKLPINKRINNYGVYKAAVH